jgi:vancomycin permeability regulator SanA
MRLDYSGTKTIQIFIVTNTRFYYMTVIIVSRFVISVKMNVNDRTLYIVTQICISSGGFAYQEKKLKRSFLSPIVSSNDSSCDIF